MNRDTRILEVADAIGLDYDITYPFFEKYRSSLETLRVMTSLAVDYAIF